MAARSPAAGLVLYPLYSERSNLYVAPGHPRYATADQDLATEDLAALSLVTDPCFDSIPVPEIASLFAGYARVRADSIEGVALLVASGRYAGTLSDPVVQDVRSLETFRAVCPSRLSYRQDIVLTCRAGNVDPSMRRLIRWVEGGGAATLSPGGAAGVDGQASAGR